MPVVRPPWSPSARTGTSGLAGVYASGNPAAPANAGRLDPIDAGREAGIVRTDREDDGQEDPAMAQPIVDWVIDADSHVTEPPDLFTKRLPAK